MVDHFFFFFITSYIKTANTKKTFITLLCATTRLTDQEKKTDQTQSECVYSSVKEQR